MADPQHHFPIDPALAPFFAKEMDAETAREAAYQRELNRAGGVCWSGMAGEPRKPRTFDAILEASIARKAAADAFAKSPRGMLLFALRGLEQLSYAAEADKVRGIYMRSLADGEAPVDCAAVGSAILCLNGIKNSTAREAIDALCELLIGGDA
jgi:hypothetical protein